MGGRLRLGGSLRPLDCCDSECALVNGCQVGGDKCGRCGEWFCGSELKENNLCADCEEEEAYENVEGDNE